MLCEAANVFLHVSEILCCVKHLLSLRGPGMVLYGAASVFICQGYRWIPRNLAIVFIAFLSSLPRDDCDNPVLSVHATGHVDRDKLYN